MTEPPILTSAVGLEAVGFSQRPDGSLTVRIAGRWLRRRPLGGGQPQLMLDRGGSRHRFPAMPEPPGLSGVAPGTWQMNFTVPASLTPTEGDRLWLALGSGAIPIPLPEDSLAVEGEGSEGADAPVGGESLLLERRARGSELALASAQQRAEQAESEVAALRRQLTGLTRELELARTGSAERDRARRDAEQRAHAESCRREELQEELANARKRPPVPAARDDELSATRSRVAELEAEREHLLRALDEADRAAGAAAAARRRAEEALHSAVDPERAPILAGEARLAGRTIVADADARGTKVPSLTAAGWLVAERRMASARQYLPGIVKGTRGSERSDPSAARMQAVLAELRSELKLLWASLRQAHSERAAADENAAGLSELLREERQRSRDAWDAIGQLREEIAASSAANSEASGSLAATISPPIASPLASRMASLAPPPARVEPAPRPGLDPSRLDAARTRLRTSEADAAVSTPAELRATGPGSEWLLRAFRALTREDALTAGRVALALLPTQRLALDGPLRYELNLSDVGAVQVTIRGHGAPVAIELGSGARAGEAAFSIEGDLPALARRLANGSSRRWLGGSRARIHGDRKAARAMLAWLRAPLTLGMLQDAGVVLEPWLALSLVVRMIDPAWAQGEHFDLAFAAPGQALAPIVVHVRAGAPLRVTQGLIPSTVATTVLSEPGSLLNVLKGSWAAGAELRGEARPLDLFLAWVERAQSG